MPWYCPVCGHYNESSTLEGNNTGLICGSCDTVFSQEEVESGITCDPSTCEGCARSDLLEGVCPKEVDNAY